MIATLSERSCSDKAEESEEELFSFDKNEPEEDFKPVILTQETLTLGEGCFFKANNTNSTELLSSNSGKEVKFEKK